MMDLTHAQTLHSLRINPLPFSAASVPHASLSPRLSPSISLSPFSSLPLSLSLSSSFPPSVQLPRRRFCRCCSLRAAGPHCDRIEEEETPRSDGGVHLEPEQRSHITSSPKATQESGPEPDIAPSFKKRHLKAESRHTARFLPPSQAPLFWRIEEEQHKGRESYRSLQPTRRWKPSSPPSPEDQDPFSVY